MKNWDTLQNKVEQHFDKHLPFVVYKKPKQKKINAFFQHDNKLHTSSNFKENGFIFAPFDNTLQAVIFPIKQCDYLEMPYKETSEVLKKLDPLVKKLQPEVSKQAYVKLLEKTVQFLTKNSLKKVVLSRKQEMELSGPVTGSLLFHLFQKMIFLYPTAFVYCWYHPAVGLWMGATPETLFSLKNNTLKTMALAATQKMNKLNHYFWTDKEKEEQAFVTDYLENTLKKVALDLKVSKPKEHPAGSLIHLKTKLKATINPTKTNLTYLIEKLHPTPAVCGTPKMDAKKYIDKNEGYHRAYYTGFLGEINKNLPTKPDRNPQADLYVNLRCLNIQNNKAYLFVGGGITKDSQPQLEWDETVNKAQTMMQILS